MSLSARLKYRVEWGHCDPARIVFYPNFFHWFDAGTRNLFEQAGVSLKGLLDEDGFVGMALLNADARFLKPSRFGDEIEVESTVTEWDRKIFQVAHRILNDDEVAVIGSETRCWGVRDREDPERIRAGVLPEEIIALFEGRT